MCIPEAQSAQSLIPNCVTSVSFAFPTQSIQHLHISRCCSRDQPTKRKHGACGRMTMSASHDPITSESKYEFSCCDRHREVLSARPVLSLKWRAEQRARLRLAARRQDYIVMCMFARHLRLWCACLSCARACKRSHASPPPMCDCRGSMQLSWSPPLLLRMEMSEIGD